MKKCTIYRTVWGDFILRATEKFLKWIKKQDRARQLKIDQRLQLITHGNLGFYRQIGEIFEIKWRKGELGSTRIYCYKKGDLILLLAGDKSSARKQNKDILLAKDLIEGIKNGKIRTKIYE